MNEVPSVTMKAGTFSLEMIAPLTKPTTAAPPTPAAKPARTEGKSGTPALKTSRIASAESTEARLITHPTERSMPAAIMTKVWPSPRSSTGMMATRMFCELRMVRKLTEPPVVSGTAMTKKRAIRPRKTHAQMRLRKMATRCAGVSRPAAAASTLSAALEARSVTRRSFSPSPRWRGEGRGEGLTFSPQAGRRNSFARDLVDEAGDRGILDVLLVDDREARLDAPRQACDAGCVGGCEHDRHIAHVERLLREHQRHDALVQELDRLLGRVIG